MISRGARWRWGVVALAMAYVGTFVLLQPRIGDGVVALTLVPVVTAAWLYGTRAGGAAAILGVAVNVFLMQTIGQHDGFRPSQIPRIIVAIAIGFATGWVRDLLRTQRRLLTENDRITASLRQNAVELELRVEARTSELVAANRALDREVAARAAAEANLRSMIEGSLDPIWAVVEGKIAFANPAVASLLGLDCAADLVGKDALSTIVPDGEREAVASRIAEIAGSQAQAMAPLEVHLSRRDGALRILEISVFPIVLDRRPATMMIGRDVTTRRALEARAAAADRMAVLGALTANIGHEINNPLAIVASNLEFIAGHDLPDAELGSATRDAQAAVLRIGEIVGQMRIFVDSSASTDPADVKRVVDVAVRLMEKELRQRAELVVDVEATRPVAMTEAQLGQLLLNLLLNANQALSERSAEQRICVHVREDEATSRVTLEVSDTGVGIPADVQYRIFEPFFTTKPTGLGTGLGLWVCHQIVTTSGGTIRILSTEGKGTTVRVELPTVTRTETDDAPESARAHTHSRVLIVDDQRAARSRGC